MNFRLLSCLLAAAVFSGCATDEIREGPKPPPAAAEWWPSNPAEIDFVARTFPGGGLEIWEKGKPVSRVRSSQPVIERWAFVKDGRQIIVRSRGAEGVPVIELFDSRTAIRRDTIPADQVVNGRPAWAASLAETAR